MASIAVVVASTLVVAASASAARTFEVSGEQIVVDQATNATVMRGGLIGDWYYTSSTEIAKTPIYQVSGTERFSGCLDVRLDGRCNNGDPSGTLSFRFDYWALFDEHGLVWGTCTHPVTGGTGAFAGAAGVLAMVDSPTPQGGVHTAYIGTLTLRRAHGGHARASAASLARANTAPRVC
jgi:hypothetical protein